MKHLITILCLYSFFLSEFLWAQPFPPLPRTAEDFYEQLTMGIVRFTIPANSGLYDLRFAEKKSFHVPLGIRFFFEETHDGLVYNDQTILKIENLELTGINTLSIEFHIDHPVDIQIRNSNFINTARLWFKMGYEDSLYNDHQQTKITIENNYLYTLNFTQDAFFSLLLFTRLMGSDDTPLRNVAYNNITVRNNHLNLLRDAEASNYVDDEFYIKRTFTSGIHINRATRGDFINDLIIDGNLVEVNNASGFDTPIWALNIENRGFTGSDNANFLYDSLKEKNRNLNITNNIFLTQSKYQSGAAFIMGPIRGLNFSFNFVDGFTRYQIHNCPETDESLCVDYRWGYEPRPVVVFYGARITKNVNNIFDGVVTSNTIKTRTSGFRINGMNIGLFKNNIVYMYPEIELPPFYNNRNYEPLSDRSAIKVSSGHAWEAKYKSRNIDIINNTIYCNNENNCAAIRLFHGTNLRVIDNFIYDFTSFGIQHESNITWADEHFVGYVTITGNHLTTQRRFNELSTNRKLLFGYLTSYEHLELDYLIPPAAISFSRLVTEDKLYQIQNENITIQDNTIHKKDFDTLPVFFENGVILSGGGHVRLKNHNASVYDYNNYYIEPNYYNEFIYDGVWLKSSIGPTSWLLGDFNGSGLTDLLLSPVPGRGAEVWFGGNGSFSNNYTGIWTADKNFGRWYAGNFLSTDNDDLLAIEFIVEHSALLHLYYSEYSSDTNRWSFKLKKTVSLPLAKSPQLLFGDFNGNGYTDILFKSPGIDNLDVLINDGNGNFYLVRNWLPTDTNTKNNYFTGDFNGDGHSDLLRPPYLNYSNSIEHAKIWLGADITNGITSEYEIWSDFTGITNGNAVNLFDNILKDLVMYNPADATFSVLKNNYTKRDPVFSDLKFDGLFDDLEDFNLFDSLQLFPNYPNPFNFKTVIQYQLPENGVVTIDIYTITGHFVNQLLNKHQRDGYHSVLFDGVSLASGVYIYRIRQNNSVQFGKMTLIK